MVSDQPPIVWCRTQVTCSSTWGGNSMRCTYDPGANGMRCVSITPPDYLADCSYCGASGGTTIIWTAGDYSCTSDGCE